MIEGIYAADGKIETGKKLPLVDVGASFYPNLVLLNHSCSPNTVRINQGKTVRRNVLQGVKRKLEININQEGAMVESPVQRQKMNSQEKILDVRDWLVDVESRTRYGGHFILLF